MTSQKLLIEEQWTAQCLNSLTRTALINGEFTTFWHVILLMTVTLCRTCFLALGFLSCDVSFCFTGIRKFGFSHQRRREEEKEDGTVAGISLYHTHFYITHCSWWCCRQVRMDKEYSRLPITQTLTNSNLLLTRTNFRFPSGHFLYNFTLDNSNSR